jgi:hypothetical protein
LKHSYKSADKFIMVNDDDPDMVAVKINLPPCPPLEEIDGYGLDPKKQKFEYQVIPQKLQDIEKRVRKETGRKEVTLDDIEEILTANEVEYKSEIEWVKTQIRRHYNGYWFFNNGKPTYITGAHYTFLNWWPIGASQKKDVYDRIKRGGLAQFRDRDRRWFISFDYIRTTREACYKFRVQYQTKDGVDYRYFNTKEAVKEFCDKFPKSITEEGSFMTVNEERTFFGMIYPKHRREGATSRAGYLNWYITATTGVEQFGGVQSLSDEHARGVFINHISKRHRQLPFWFKFVTDGPSVPKNELIFDIPATRTVGAVGTTGLMGHGGGIDYRASGERAYDSTKLWFIHLDEIGKVDTKAGMSVDNINRWDVVRKCLAQGPYIHGVSLLTSTLGEMTAGGGEVMRKMILDAMWEKRDDNGNTPNGLMTVFFPAQDGLDGFIDEYGNSIIDDPETPILNSEGKLVKIGALTYLNNKRRDKELSGNESGLIEEMQNFPQCLKECFMGSAKSSFMPVLDIRKRIAELRMQEHQTKRGFFEWMDRVRFGKVVFVEDPKGPYTVSWLQVADKRNMREIKQHYITSEMCYHPNWQTMDKLTLGVDSAQYSAKEVDGKTKSYHAMMLFYGHDESIDRTTGHDAKDRVDWVSDSFVLDMKTREMDGYQFAEECLKVCMFYGAMCYPEMNVKDVYMKFREWNMQGYLKYDVNEHGEPALKPGYVVSDGAQNTTKQDAIAGIERYIRSNVKYEKHMNLLIDCKDIAGPQEMTKYDMFAAACAALRGARSNYVKELEAQEKEMEISEPIFAEYNY